MPTWDEITLHAKKAPKNKSNIKFIWSKEVLGLVTNISNKQTNHISGMQVNHANSWGLEIIKSRKNRIKSLFMRSYGIFSIARLRMCCIMIPISPTFPRQGLCRSAATPGALLGGVPAALSGCSGGKEVLGVGGTGFNVNCSMFFWHLM